MSINGHGMGMRVCVFIYRQYLFIMILRNNGSCRALTTTRGFFRVISLPVNNSKFGYSPGNLLALYIPPDETCFFVHLLFGLHFKTDCSLIYVVCSLQFVFTLTVKSYENCHFLKVSQDLLIVAHCK